MISYPLSAIAAITGGTLLGDQDPLIHYILTDSRSPIPSVHTLFIALKGERHDAHQYINDLYATDVVNFLVETLPDGYAAMPGATFVIVPDTLRALQVFAAFHRNKSDIPVIGITGSNGKTVVKEWLYYLLGPEKHIVRSPRSYNSQVGVPLSVLLLEEEARLAIFEAGISRPGEMKLLADIIQPTIGILTNLGEAHQENFTGHNQKLQEKLQLFTGSNTLIYGSDNVMIHSEITRLYGHSGMQLASWSKTGDASVRVMDISREGNHTVIHYMYEGVKNKIRIPFTDEASVENSISCLVCLLEMKLMDEHTVRRFDTLPQVAMRLELKNGINSCTLINDSYNSDFVSLIVALDFLMQQRQNPAKMLILSDILQSGRNEHDLYEEVAQLLENKKIDQLVGIGEALFRNRDLFTVPATFYRTTAEFLEKITKSKFQDKAILLKGARAFQFERITEVLEQKTHATRFEINLNALVHNLNYFRSLLKPGTKIMVMVKALSYGSGTFEIANLLQFNKVDYLAVAYTDEGIALRRFGTRLPILVMSPEPGAFDALIEHHLEPELYSLNLLEHFIQFLASRGLKHYPVHIKLDTGMRRLGLDAEDIPRLRELLENSEEVLVQTVFSHLAASEDALQDDFSRQQIERFRSASDVLQQGLRYRFMRHILNSAGIERFPLAQFDMVRLGIGLYGISTVDQSRLRNIGTLKTVISQVKKIGKGETIGYGRKGLAHENMLLATLPIGYADGLSRKLGNGIASFMLNGKLAPTVGNICMDMCMIDITGIQAAEGDEVVIFGDSLPVTQLAEYMQTIPYEVLTGISGRVKRVYYQE